MAAAAARLKEPVCLEPVKVRQLESWDCGLACIAMVLAGRLQLCDPGVGWTPEHSKLALSHLLDVAGTDSVWTIDLCVVLNELGFQWAFYTTLAGVAPSHGSLPFYSGLNEDKQRVLDRFRRFRGGEGSSSESAITETNHVAESGPARSPVLTNRGAIHEQKLSLEDLLDVLEGNSCVAAIVLVDLRFLHSSTDSYGKSTVKRMIPSYAGHYILLLGKNAKDQLEYLDPASPTVGPDEISMECFDTARMAEGTDQDVIFIERCLEDTSTWSRLLKALPSTSHDKDEAGCCAT